ncbi:MAG: energy transducer TonB [Candidatus Solibacter sp.]
MFETATLSYGSPAKRVWATALGFTGQAMLIGGALLAPMVFPQTLGKAFLITSLTAPGPPPPPPAPPGPRVVPKGARPVITQFNEHVLTSPVSIPARAEILIDEPPVLAGSGTGIVGGSTGGDPNGIAGGVLDTVRADAPRPTLVARIPEPKAPPAVAPVVKAPRITQLQMATPIRRVDPIYPKIAIAAHVSGTVELLGVLGADGRIHELKVLRGHPLLIKAAMDAVLQWVYEPTILNGQAVEVSAPISVNFILR